MEIPKLILDALLNGERFEVMDTLDWLHDLGFDTTMLNPFVTVNVWNPEGDE